MKALKVAIAMMAMMICTAAFAGDQDQPFAFGDDDSGLKSYYVQPCSYWHYDFDARAYVCNSLGSRMQVYDTYEVDRAIDQLLRRIESLESRVAALEAGN